MKLVMLLFAFMTFSAVAADKSENELGIFVGGWSYHYVHKKTEHMNQRNDLLAVQYNNLVLGTFENSYGDRTYMGGYDFSWKNEYIDYGVVAGLDYGYCGTNQKKYFSDRYACDTGHVLPFVMPYVSYSQFAVQPTIGLMWNAVVFTVKIKI